VSFLTKHRVALAFILTPAICSAAVTLVGASAEDAIFAFVVLSAVSALIALPLFILLRAMNWLRWFHAVAVGALCGAVPCLLIGIDLKGAGAAAAAGSAVGLLFWFLALYRNATYVHRHRETI
jgi:hypothetical protein